MNICVFCSSKQELVEPIQKEADQFSKALVSSDCGFVYGGGAAGLMGYFADRIIELGGRTYGVMPEGAFEQEVAHQGLTELYYTKDMLDRKRKMMDMSDAFVAFPGGIGTIDEVLEVMTWETIYKLKKPIVFYNWQGFWDPFLEMLKSYEKTKLFYPETMQSFAVVDHVDDILKECHVNG